MSNVITTELRGAVAKAEDERRKAGRGRVEKDRRVAELRRFRQRVLKAVEPFALEEATVRADPDLTDVIRARKLEKIAVRRADAIADELQRFRKQARELVEDAYPAPRPITLGARTSKHTADVQLAISRLQLAAADRDEVARVVAELVPGVLRNDEAAAVVLNTILPTVRMLAARTRDTGPEARANADALGEAITLAERAARPEHAFAAERAAEIVAALDYEAWVVAQTVAAEGRWVGTMAERAMGAVYDGNGNVKTRKGSTPEFDVQDVADGLAIGTRPGAPSPTTRVKLTRAQAADFQTYETALKQVDGDHGRIDITDERGEVITWDVGGTGGGGEQGQG